jgi:predicted membrane protein
MGNNKNSYSWPLIILLLIVFWPVGLYLLYKKAQSDKKTALTAAKLLNGLGTFFIIFGVITVFVGIGIFYLILGIVLKKFAKKLKESADNVKKYLTIVINGNVRQLDAISAAVGKPYDAVKADLQKMIDDGYFKNAYIDEAAREIVLAQPTAQANSAPMGAASATVTTRVVACPCCGANNTISGATGECEYCGSPLS